MEKIFGIVHFQVKPGHSAAFLECARACMTAAQVDLAGTHAYEWFMTPGGEECIVIEAYDGAEGIANHSRHVGKTIAPLLEYATSDVMLLGDVPAEIAQRMASKFSRFDLFAPRFQGLLTEPAPGVVAADAGGRIFAVARFAIAPGNLDQFCDLARECFAVVERDDPGTIGYEWFIDREGMRCVTIDIYHDAAALAAHMKNAGDCMRRILQLVSSEVALYGAVPAEMVARLQGGLGVRYVAPQVQGIL